MTRRWLGGVYGNTVGSDTDVGNTTGVFSMEQQYYMKQEGGWEVPPLGTQGNPATGVAALVADGQTTNGYYWIKGTGLVADARQFYCILDTGFSLGAGWMVVANHDAAKQPSSSHQARLTSYSNHVGYDNSSGNGSVNQHPTASVMVPERSFSCSMANKPFTKFAHVVYASSNMASWNSNNLLTPLSYYGGTWNSAVTVPNAQAWQKQIDNTGVTFNGFARRIYYGNGNNYAVQCLGVYWGSGGGTPTINGSGATAQDYPLYCGCFTYTDANNATATLSFSDYANVSSAQQGLGFDDMQDGSGLSDNWLVENVGANAYRGNPSCLLVG
tara:strand:- start:49 stop:1032 length:984 start_codon:yes stop_codon:yes gene_type:complete